MVRRPRCRTCERRIWPWQASGGWGVMGAKDNHRTQSYMQHIACMEADRQARLAEREASHHGE